MIVFSPNYPQAFLPKGAPRVAIIDDRTRRGWRFICKLITEAGAEVVVIPRSVSDHYLNKQGVCAEAIHALRQMHCNHTALDEQFAWRECVRQKHLEQVDSLLAGIDAIVLPGNFYDVPPTSYGEAVVHPKTKLTHPLDFRFDTERVMLEHGFKRNLPTLGVCGGMQLMVVATGGKLVQHLPDVLDANGTIHDGYIETVCSEKLDDMECDYVDFIDQPEKEPPVDANHPVQINASDSRIAHIAQQCFGALEVCSNPSIGVLSVHHQGAFESHINASEMRVTAIAPDGVVEAVEHVSHPFCIGTQFHPEYDTRGLAMPLIKALLESSKR